MRDTQSRGPSFGRFRATPGGSPVQARETRVRGDRSPADPLRVALDQERSWDRESEGSDGLCESFHPRSKIPLCLYIISALVPRDDSHNSLNQRRGPEIARCKPDKLQCLAGRANSIAARLGEATCRKPHKNISSAFSATLPKTTR